MSVLLTGVGMGFAIAAPVGPIGLLCIRRTLQQGPAVGLATGLGAAVADAGYGLLVAGGLAATGLLLRHATVLSLVGACLLLALGLQSLRAFAAKSHAGVDPSLQVPVGTTSLVAAFASTFVLTATNPATIVAFVGLIASVASVAGSTATGASAPYRLVLGVFAGSLLWWMLLVAMVRSVRGLVKGSALRWLDALTGVVLVAMAAWVAATAVLG
jgi:threonine/homoserine/homoserine lactone efflux protein